MKEELLIKNQASCFFNQSPIPSLSMENLFAQFATFNKIRNKSQVPPTSFQKLKILTRQRVCRRKLIQILP